VRRLILCSLLAALVGLTAPAAHAARLSYANFNVTVSGVQTSQVSGSEECQDDAGTIAPASASETATFSTPSSRKLQFERAGRELNIGTPSGIGEATVTAKATIERQSGFSSNGSNPPVCPGGQPNPNCGTASLNHIKMLVQGGHNKISLLVDDFRGFQPGGCLVPVAFAFPNVLPPQDDENHSHIRYSAKAPSSLLNPHKRVVIIHGKGTAANSGQEGSIHVTSATSTLRFTMRLRRASLR
jgi:hypothetical protein